MYKDTGNICNLRPGGRAIMFMNTNKSETNIRKIIRENRVRCGRAGIMLDQSYVVSKGPERDIDRDAALCEEAGADVVFHPEPEEMYFPDSCTFVDMDHLTKGLCGKTRPTHFKGVCTVVSKLFNIVTPDRAYFGEKDAQQLAVIRRMVRDLNFNITIVGCPIVREEDGLAMSSRNTYLNPAERKAALILHKSLALGEEMLKAGEKDAGKVRNAIVKHMKTERLARIDYVELVDAESLEPVKTITGSILAAVAVYIGKTRLIDNFSFHPGQEKQE